MTPKDSGAFTAEEKAAMKQAAAEARAQKARAGKADKAAADLVDVLEKIAAMPDDERELAQKVHETVMAAAPGLAPRTFYGSPAYAQDGKVLCFFQEKSKFKVRYNTFAFQDGASLDDGDMWPTSFAVVAWSDEVERTITDLVRRATSAG